VSFAVEAVVEPLLEDEPESSLPHAESTSMEAATAAIAVVRRNLVTVLLLGSRVEMV
jgi:hypothetical protein